MKILIVMDPGILVPPKNYGGHERLVYMFAREYAKMGHEVHLLVTEGSEVEGCTIHVLGKEGFPPPRKEAFVAIPKAWFFLWKNRNKFDLVHNFGRLLYLLPILNDSLKKIMTYGREISSGNINKINKLPTKNLVFTGCSKNLISRVKAGGRWEAVYNAIEFNKYTVQPLFNNESPLMFLGRIERIKGAHTAIAIAKKTGNSLLLAGNISPLEEEQRYFKEEIEPHIDGFTIKYIGALDDVQKSHYLGMSKALLFPIEWNEPFGMVMVEAMACGTPVIGYKRGSVDEVITEGVTGFKVDDFAGMEEKVIKLHTIDRTNCRKVAYGKFDVSVIANKYLNLWD